MMPHALTEPELRDYFAAQALIAFGDLRGALKLQELASLAYKAADAMLAQRKVAQ